VIIILYEDEPYSLITPLMFMLIEIQNF